MKIPQILRVYHTIRHLKPVQVVNRLQRRLIRPRWPRLEAPPLRSPAGVWCSPCVRAPSLVGPDQLRVFGNTLPLRSAQDWRDPQLDHLVQYNLHYFDDLTAVEAHSRTAWHQRLIDRWIEQNLPGQGPGWDPYPLSIRIVNWIKWSLNGHSLSTTELDSLATQTEALVEQLEYHLLANHLLANAKALIFAGAFFQGARADRWLSIGSRILQQQVAEQVLADGGHFELSPMYHSLILEDLLDLRNLSTTYMNATLKWTDALLDPIDRMRHWLNVMTHPDGQIAFFNDAAEGIAIAPGDLHRYAERLGLPPTRACSMPLTYLPESGYVRMQQDNNVLLLDVARVGPDYQPGHAHADTLSFEWSRGTQRIVVNSGTSCYGLSGERQRQRATRAHSTVEIDGQDSSEVWSGFRVARRAYPGKVEISESRDTLQVSCSHNGYLRLPGRVTHGRHWTLSPQQLSIADKVSGHYQRATARYFLHPQVVYQPGPSNGDFALTVGSERLQGGIVGGQPRCVSSTYHPRFGASEPNFCIESDFLQAAHELLFHWTRPSLRRLA